MFATRLARPARTSALFCALLCALPSLAAAQTRSSDSLADEANDGFAWYEPSNADGTLPVPPPPPPEMRQEPVPISQQSPPSVMLSAGAYGRAYFAGTPEGLGSEFSARLSFGNAQWIGVEAGVLLPTLMPKFGLTLGVPFALTLASITPQVQLQLVLPMFRLGAGFLPVTVQSGTRTVNRMMALLAPELMPVGIRITSCMRFFVEARVEGPGAWLTFGNTTNTFTMGFGASINVGVGFGGDPPSANYAVVTTVARRRRACDGSLRL